MNNKTNTVKSNDISSIVKIKNSGSTEYYELQYILYDENNKPCDFVIGKLLSNQGKYGQVHEARCNSNSNSSPSKYILKKIYNRSSVVGGEAFLLNLAAKHGLAPKVILEYYMDGEGGIVMERVKYTILEVLSKTIEDKSVFDGLDLEELSEKMDSIINNSSSYPEYKRFIDEFNQLYTFKEEIVLKAIYAIKNLHGLRIGHEDAHLNNIMVDEDGNIKFVDFGASMYWEPENEEEAKIPIHEDLDYYVFHQSLIKQSEQFEKEADKYPNDSIEHIQKQVISYHLGYLADYFDDKLKELSLSDKYYTLNYIYS